MKELGQPVEVENWQATEERKEKRVGLDQEAQWFVKAVEGLSCTSWDSTKNLYHVSLGEVSEALPHLGLKTTSYQNDEAQSCAEYRGDGVWRLARFGGQEAENTGWVKNGDQNFYQDIKAPTGPQARVFEFTDYADFRKADHKIEWVVEKFIVKGEGTLVAGAAKALKTLQMADLALSVATGTRWMGKFKTAQMPVMFFTGEMAFAVLNFRCEAIEKARNLKVPKGAICLCKTVPKFRDVNDPSFEQKLKSFQPGLVVFDPAYQAVMGESASNLALTGEQLEYMQWVCESYGAVFVVVHHTTKHAGRQTKPLGLYDASGSAYAEWAGQYYIVSRREEYAGGGLHQLWAHIGGRHGHCNNYQLDLNEGDIDKGEIIWTPKFTHTSEVKSVDEEEKYQWLVTELQTLKLPEPLTITRIRLDHLDLKSTQAREWLKSCVERLEFEGILVPVDATKKNKRYTIG
jgi:hypothetical protein